MVVKVSFSHHINHNNIQFMNTIFRNYKPFEYKVYNNKAELEEYSGGFLTKEDALKWYNEHGVWLENQFKRTLVLVNNTYQHEFNF